MCGVVVECECVVGVKGMEKRNPRCRSEEREREREREVKRGGWKEGRKEGRKEGECAQAISNSYFSNEAMG